MDRQLWDNLAISFFPNTRAPKWGDMSISRVLEGIRNGGYAKEVTSARVQLHAGNKAEYDRIKSLLPAVTFSGTFRAGHSEAECEHYNSIFVLDIDHLDDDQLVAVRDSLSRDPFVAVYWLSPSGRGFKGLIPLTYVPDMQEVMTPLRHRAAFRQIFHYLLTVYDIELDSSGKDICRLCYMSYDPEIVIKDTFEPFEVQYEEITNPKGSGKVKTKSVSTVPESSWNEIKGRAAGYPNHAENRAILEYLYKKLKRKNLSITATYEDWLKVAFAIASSIHPTKGRDLFLQLCRLDGDRHDEAKSERLILDAYQKNLKRCSMKSILYLARQKGIELK